LSQTDLKSTTTAGIREIGVVATASAFRGLTAVGYYYSLSFSLYAVVPFRFWYSPVARFQPNPNL